MPTNTRRRGGGEALPQLGGPGERYTVISKKTGLPRTTRPTALRFSNPDLGEAVMHAAAMQNFAHSIRTAHPEAVARGARWYPQVHEAVSKGIRGRGSRGFLSG